jgi:hypothetical protein
MNTKELEHAVSQLADVVAILQKHLLKTQKVLTQHLEMHHEQMGSQHSVS